VPLATTRRTGLVDQVIEQMRKTIASGEWPVGQRIPAEPELVSALGVGRNTVREAVRALAHAGLLEVRQGDGTFVRATSELSGAVRRLVGDEFREVLEVRRTLEMEGARLAAKHRTDEDIAQLEALLGERNTAADEHQWELMIERDAAFHLLIVQSSHNALLTELYRGLTEVVKASVAATVNVSPRDAEQISHDGILDAVRAGAPERAAREAGSFLDELLKRHSADQAS
jgi:DNA-binding FadR family transcriptional regulator